MVELPVRGGRSYKMHRCADGGNKDCRRRSSLLASAVVVLVLVLVEGGRLCDDAVSIEGVLVVVMMVG